MAMTLYQLTLLLLLAVTKTTIFNARQLDGKINVTSSERSECKRQDLQECTCFELLQLNTFRAKGQAVDKSDVKKGIRKAIKLYYPDEGGSEDGFRVLQTCHSKLQLCAEARQVSPSS
jgi:hypothetical protein